MLRQRTLQVILVVAGLLFCALAYAAVVYFRRDPAAAMLFTVYATLGAFLLMAVRNPSGHRSLIAFTAWSSLAHAALMAAQVCLHCIVKQELMGVLIFGLIGIALIVVAPPKKVATA